MPPIILASGSPRRRDLLAWLGLPFTVEVSDEPEEVDPALPPEQQVLALAERKARAVAARHASGLVIGGDTVVAVDDDILGKPRDDADAVAMLVRLSGRLHEVWTGLVVVDAAKGEVACHAVPSALRFRPLSSEDIAAYVVTGEGRDKAGAYAVQGVGRDLVEVLFGCWTNVVGLPLCEAASLLKRFGVAIPAVDPVCTRPNGSACPRLAAPDRLGPVVKGNPPWYSPCRRSNGSGSSSIPTRRTRRTTSSPSSTPC
jgi:septum formation protein